MPAGSPCFPILYRNPNYPFARCSSDAAFFSRVKDALKLDKLGAWSLCVKWSFILAGDFKDILGRLWQCSEATLVPRMCIQNVHSSIYIPFTTHFHLSHVFQLQLISIKDRLCTYHFGYDLSLSSSSLNSVLPTHCTSCLVILRLPWNEVFWRPVFCPPYGSPYKHSDRCGHSQLRQSKWALLL